MQRAWVILIGMGDGFHIVEGGQFVKSYGNFDCVISFDNRMRDEMQKQQGCACSSRSLWFKEG